MHKEPTFRQDIVNIINAVPEYKTDELLAFASEMKGAGLFGDITDDEMDTFETLTEAAETAFAAAA